MYSIQINHINYSFDKHHILNDFSINFEKNKMTCLLGPSGSGKTTVLRLIAGLATPTFGSIHVNNELVSADGKIIIAPHKRETGFIFQDLALWPHFTVYENIAFGLKERKQKNISGEVAQILDIFGIGSKVRKFPHELSGGQKQMVAIARSLVLKPKILLMDEPLANIDEIIKNKIIIHLQQLREAQPFTIIYVTHDHNEAVQWGDNLVIMQQGKLIESGKTSEMLQAKYLFIK